MNNIIEKVKLLTNETNSDLIRIFVEHARDIILNKLYPYVDDISNVEFPLKYENKLIEVATYLYLKQGAEGETSHNENGVSRTYENASVPKSMLRDIMPYAKVVR